MTTVNSFSIPSSAISTISNKISSKVKLAAQKRVPVCFSVHWWSRCEQEALHLLGHRCLLMDGEWRMHEVWFSVLRRDLGACLEGPRITLVHWTSFCFHALVWRLHMRKGLSWRILRGVPVYYFNLWAHSSSSVSISHILGIVVNEGLNLWPTWFL